MRGLTLIETVIAFTLLLLLILFVFSLAPGSLLSLTRAHHQIAASNLAQSILEEQRNRSLADLAPHADAAEPIYKLEDGLELNPFVRVSSTGVPSACRVVRVTVRWKERDVNCETFRESVVTKIYR